MNGSSRRLPYTQTSVAKSGSREITYPRLWAVSTLIAMLFATVGASAQMRWSTSVTVVQEGKWAGKRLSDGQPDVEGVWSNDIANHDNFTDPQGGIPGDPSKGLRVANGAVDRPSKP